MNPRGRKPVLHLIDGQAQKDILAILMGESK